MAKLLDSLPMSIIKASFEYICEALLYALNSSLMTGIFPDKLKIAKVIPLFKANDPCSKL